MQQEPLFVRTKKKQKIAEFFAKLRNFVVGLAEKLRQDLATVLVKVTSSPCATFQITVVEITKKG